MRIHGWSGMVGRYVWVRVLPSGPYGTAVTVPESGWKRQVTGSKPAFIPCPESETGGQTARPAQGGQHPVSISALSARSRNEFNPSSQPAGPVVSGGSGRGFGICLGSVVLLSSLLLKDFPPSGPCRLDSPGSAKQPICPLTIHVRRVWIPVPDGPG